MDTNLSSLGYIEETTFGTTPSGNMQLLRRTGGSFTPSQPTITSGEIRSNLRPGAPIRTSQMANGNVNVEWSYGTLDDMLEGVLMSAWNSNVLVDGTTKKSYTFEEQFEDTGVSPNQYFIYKGSRIASLSMSLALDSIVTGSVGVMTATPSLAQASAGTGDSAATTTDPWNCTDMISAITEGGVAITKVVGLELQLDRALRPKRQVGALNPFDIGVGRLMVTGTITQYFENDTIADKYFGSTESSIAFTLTDAAGNDLAVSIGKIKYVGDLGKPVQGPDGDVMISANFQASADVADASQISFTRSPA